MAAGIVNAYDQLPYNNQPQRYTHPGRLCVLGRLAGLDAPPVETCRVLELGANEGANILSLAMLLPNAQFLGVDLAQEPVARGRKLIADAGLTNVRLEAADLLDLDSSLGEFDYIITHGLYAWVPPAVRDKILAISSECLAPNGIAYVSYNAQPTGAIRNMLRDMLRYHVAGISDPSAKLARARELLKTLAEGRPNPDPYDDVAAHHARVLLGHSDSMLYHDTLADISEPVYFHEFAAHAGAHGLQYLGDAGLSDRPRNLTQETIQAAVTLGGGDRVRQQQYLDFVRMRAFRWSLLCHAGIEISDAWPPSAVVGAYASSPAVREPDGAFRTPHVRLETDHPVPVEYLTRLGALWPLSEPVAEKDAMVALELFKVGIVELCSNSAAAHKAGDRPCASPLVRAQAANEYSVVVTLAHGSLETPGEDSRRLLLLLDGTRDRDELAARMSCSRERVDEELRALERFCLFTA